MTLSAAELADMADEVEAVALAGTAVIYTRTWTADTRGGGSVAYTASGTAACAIAPQTPPQDAEPTTGSRITPESDWIVTLPASQAITPEARLAIDGTTYEVTALHAPRTYEVARRVEVSVVN